MHVLSLEEMYYLCSVCVCVCAYILMLFSIMKISPYHFHWFVLWSVAVRNPWNKQTWVMSQFLNPPKVNLKGLSINHSDFYKSVYVGLGVKEDAGFLLG